MSRLINLGSYELIDRIATGGMAEIYLARARGIHDFERIFVLKLIHPKYVGDSEFMRMFIDEAKLVARLHHVNIAQVFDLGHSEDNYFIVMEYVEGRDLSDVLEVSKSSEIPIPVNVALDIASQMLCGLYYAHSKSDERGRTLNIVHRDITPQNILLSFFGEVKIADFGVAKAAMSARPETQAGIIKGKFKYMSPEQAWGDRLDGRSDVFSAALTLYELLCGQSPYDVGDEGIDPRQTIMRMREAKIPPISHMRTDVPKALDDILAKALARDRNQRFDTALDFQIAINEVRAELDPGFSNADTMELMRRLYPQMTKDAFVPISANPRFGDPYRQRKDPSDARTLEVEQTNDELLTADRTVPVITDGDPDATDETVSMPPLARVQLDEEEELSASDILIEDLDVADADDETVTTMPLSARIASNSDDIETNPDTHKRTKPNRGPTARMTPHSDYPAEIPAFGSGPFQPQPHPQAHQPLAKPADHSWLEPFPENARPTVQKVGESLGEVLGLEPPRAFFTGVFLLSFLGFAMMFAFVAIVISL